MELRFVARQSDFLLLEAEDGSSHRLLLDDSLKEAVRNNLEIKSSGIVPKEVQQRLRAGLTIEQVAVELGVTESAIEPFAAPILDEIRFVLQSALGTLVSDGQAMRTLEQLILTTEPEAQFQASRDEQGWVITASGSNASYTWKFDPKGKLLEPVSETARKLANLHSARDVVSQTVPVKRPEQSSPAAATEPAAEEPAEASVHDLVEELRSRRTRNEELKPSSAKGRASLPSWDEIVSGAHLDPETD